MDLTSIAAEYSLPSINLADTLSRRERLIVTLMACGASGSEIAEMLCVSPIHVRRTVWTAKQRIITVCDENRIRCPRPFPTPMLTRWVVELGWHQALLRPRRLAPTPIPQVAALVRGQGS